MESWKELPIVLIHGTTSWKDLPPALATNILSRVPVKTLIRSTSVCTSWYSLIKNPRFIYEHITRSISYANDNDSHHILITRTFSSIAHTCSIICEKTSVEQLKLEIPSCTESKSIKISGSCNGLICLTDASPIRFGRDLFLWNPSVRKHKQIGSSCFVGELSDWTKTYPVIGFGFVKPHNDYRIVRIVYCVDNAFNFHGPVAPKVEVYSLRKDSWRRVGATVPRIASHEHWAFVNGGIYWLEAKKDNSHQWIISFDLNSEVFREVKLPDNFRNGVGQDASVTLTEFKGLLSLFAFDLSKDYGGIQRCSVWVMKENDAAVSWTKQFNVVLQERIGLPMKFTKSGKLILEAMDRIPEFTKLVLYDLAKLKFIDLGDEGPYTVDACFMESLVLFEGGNALLRHKK